LRSIQILHLVTSTFVLHLATPNTNRVEEHIQSGGGGGGYTGGGGVTRRGGTEQGECIQSRGGVQIKQRANNVVHGSTGHC